MEILRTVLQAFVQELCKIFSGAQMPMRPWTRIERIDDHTTSYPVESRPDTTSLAIAIFQANEKLETLQVLVNAIESDPDLLTRLTVDAAGKPILDAHSRRYWIMNFLAVPVALLYFAARREIIYDQGLFDVTFDQFIARLETPTRKSISLSPLLNVKIVSDSVEICPGLKLRNLTTNELEEWLNSMAVVTAPGLSIPSLIDVQCAVEESREVGSGPPPFETHQPDQTNRLVDVLRLFTDCNVYSLFTQDQSYGGGYLSVGEVSQSWASSIRRPGKTATLDDESSKNLVALWHQLQASPNTNRMELAFKRWSATAERVNDDDQLIDYWIALESLFTSDSSQEVTFRASLRIAAFLGQTPDERETIYNDMRHSYNWRSSIVHGDTMKPGKIKELNKKGTLPEVTKRTRSYLRTALLRLSEMHEVFDPQKIELQLLREYDV